MTWADNWEEIHGRETLLDGAHESEVETLLDSGACDHVCSPEFEVQSPLLPRLDTGVVRNANGGEIPTHGRRRVRLRLEGGQIASVECQVMNVKRWIFNIGRLIEQGFRIDFERQVLTGPDGRQAQIHRQGRLYHLRAQLLETERATQVGSKSRETKKRSNRTRGRQRECAHSVRANGCSDSKRCERGSTTNREGTK